jgi:hypothetical protein
LHGEDFDNGWAIPIMRLTVAYFPATVQVLAAPVKHRWQYLIFREGGGDLLRTFTVQRHVEYAANDGGGFRVDNPAFAVRVFGVPIGRQG